MHWLRHYSKLQLFIGTLVALVLGIGSFTVIDLSTYQHYGVSTGSMEPTIPPGSEVFIEQHATYPVGAVVTFDADGKILTHRIVGYRTDGSVITRGDANRSPDVWRSHTTRVSDIRGQVWLAPQRLGWLLDSNWWAFEIHQPMMIAAILLLILGLSIAIWLFFSPDESTLKSKQEVSTT
jgi:signal peptidase I